MCSSWKTNLQLMNPGNEYASETFKMSKTAATKFSEVLSRKKQSLFCMLNFLKIMI